MRWLMFNSESRITCSYCLTSERSTICLCARNRMWAAIGWTNRNGTCPSKDRYATRGSCASKVSLDVVRVELAMRCSVLDGPACISQTRNGHLTPHFGSGELVPKTDETESTSSWRPVVRICPLWRTLVNLNISNPQRSTAITPFVLSRGRLGPVSSLVRTSYT